MKPLGDRKRHYWLAQRMAKTTETDLVGAHAAGDLSQEKWAEMVESCRGCDWIEGCERWLAKPENAGEVPGSCPNCGTFLELKQAAAEGR